MEELIEDSDLFEELTSESGRLSWGAWWPEQSTRPEVERRSKESPAQKEGRWWQQQPWMRDDWGYRRYLKQEPDCTHHYWPSRENERDELREQCRGHTITVIPKGERGKGLEKELEYTPIHHEIQRIDYKGLLFDGDGEIAPIREFYVKRCVFCDHPGPSASYAEVSEFKAGKHVDLCTGQFLCTVCKRNVSKQIQGLKVPKIKLDSRGRMRQSEAAIPELADLERDCPDLYTQLLGDGDGDETRENLGAGSYRRVALLFD